MTTKQQQSEEMMVDYSKWTMIRIRKETHKGLIDLAKYGDSMSDVIEMLLESYHENKGKSSSTSTSKDKVIKK
jgi:hypothetical protein